MKLKITEVEATAEELKASQPLASSLSNLLRNAFMPRDYTTGNYTEETDEQAESEVEHEIQTGR